MLLSKLGVSGEQNYKRTWVTFLIYLIDVKLTLLDEDDPLTIIRLTNFWLSDAGLNWNVEMLCFCKGEGGRGGKPEKLEIKPQNMNENQLQQTLHTCDDESAIPKGNLFLFGGRQPLQTERTGG